MTKFSEYKNKSWIYSAVLILCVLQPVLDVISYWLDEWKSDNTVSLALRFIIFLAVVIISLIVYLGLDTIWLWILTGDAIYGLLPVRLIKVLILIPVQIATILITWKYLSRFLKTRIM